MDLVTVMTYTTSIDAYADQAYLESQGIKTFLMNEDVVNANWLLSNAVGGVQLQVDKSNFQKASKLLSDIKKDTEKSKHMRNYRDNGKCPFCKSDNITIRRYSPGFIVFGILLLGIPFILPMNKKGYCYECSRRWTF